MSQRTRAKIASGSVDRQRQIATGHAAGCGFGSLNALLAALPGQSRPASRTRRERRARTSCHPAAGRQRCDETRTDRPGLVWATTMATGIAFDSSAGFTLPNGAIRSPDASWMPIDRWNALTTQERARDWLRTICPDFVVELRSRVGYARKSSARRCRSISARGPAGLADRSRATAPSRSIGPAGRSRVFEKPATLSGEDVLPGFVLDLKGILFD